MYHFIKYIFFFLYSSSAFFNSIISSRILHSTKNIFLDKYPSNPCNKIESRELQIKININDISEKHMNTLRKISGFYGLVGPDIKINYLTTLYDLFTGDGMIQGVFFKDGNITFVKHFVRTEKLLFEEKFGAFSKKFYWTPLFIALNKIGILPNVLGLANTAALVIDNKMYTLFERDVPYLMDINFENQTIQTVKKVLIPGIERFSAHSKYDPVTKVIHSIDYSVIYKTLTYLKMSSQFQFVRRFDIFTKKLPIIHDFAILNDDILFCESPFELDICRFLYSKIPVRFSKDPTKIIVYNSKQNSVNEYFASDPFYIFHYGQVIENVENICFYAPVYDNIDFDSLNIKGNYRMFSINKISGLVTILKNDEIERYNLDFPIVYVYQAENITYTILRNIENNAINGFVVCNELNIVKTIFLQDNRHICGEPSLIDIEGSPYLIALAYDNLNKGYIEIIPVFDYYYDELNHRQYKDPAIIEIELPCNTTIGFHSVFLHP